MNNSELMVTLFIGAVLMCVLLSYQMKWYGLAIWKSIVISIALVITGLIGSRIWYYVENGTFRGRSFYGAIFLAPVVFFSVSKIIKIQYGHSLDFCATAGCLALSLVKIQCLRDGCCDGMVLYLDANYNYVKFPSQIVEMIAFLVIGTILFLVSSKEKNRGKIFPLFLCLYGASRFVLNFFRDGIEPYALGLSAGSFWSLISFVAGCLILTRGKCKVVQKRGV